MLPFDPHQPRARLRLRWAAATEAPDRKAPWKRHNSIPGRAPPSIARSACKRQHEWRCCGVRRSSGTAAVSRGSRRMQATPCARVTPSSDPGSRESARGVGIGVCYSSSSDITAPAACSRPAGPRLQAWLLRRATAGTAEARWPTPAAEAGARRHRALPRKPAARPALLS